MVVTIDPYLVLGVDRRASAAEIKRAYRKLVKDLHPDKHAGTEERFREAQQAYDLVGRDPAKRAEWDAAHPSQFTAIGDAAAFATLIREQPNGGRKPHGAMPGKDIEAEVSITLAQAALGDTVPVTVPLDEVCPECEGDRTRRVQCADCGGSGLKTERGDELAATRICASCSGSGKVVCNRCKGVGRTSEQREHLVKIPAGVEEGTRIRIPGKGAGGLRGGEPGDLYVVTHVASSDLFERNGSSLIIDVPVTYPEAVLGATVELPTLDGPISLRVPALSQPGRLLRVRGRGAFVLGSKSRGDLFARIVITLPSELSDDEHDLLGLLREVSTEDPRAHFKTRVE